MSLCCEFLTMVIVFFFKSNYSINHIFFFTANVSSVVISNFEHHAV